MPSICKLRAMSYGRGPVAENAAHKIPFLQDLAIGEHAITFSDTWRPQFACFGIFLSVVTEHQINLLCPWLSHLRLYLVVVLFPKKLNVMSNWSQKQIRRYRKTQDRKSPNVLQSEKSWIIVFPTKWIMFFNQIDVSSINGIARPKPFSTRVLRNLIISKKSMVSN